MARRHKHEDHANHEAWAIPYGDLITLLLAFFVVMYAMSSVNEGKYRVLSDSLVSAFNGAPKTLEPIQVGEKQVGPGATLAIDIARQPMSTGSRSARSSRSLWPSMGGRRSTNWRASRTRSSNRCRISSIASS